MPRIRHLYISPGHNYFGHHGRPAGENPIVEVDSVECVAGKGLRGDRFFDFKDDYKGQATLFAWDVFEKLREAQGKPGLTPAVLRRNVVVEGLDLDSLVGKRFELQGVALEGTGECKPCYWMDQAIGSGAEAWLQGRGGLRCKIHSDGVLRRD